MSYKIYKHLSTTNDRVVKVLKEARKKKQFTKKRRR